MSDATVPARSKLSPFPWRCGECGQEAVKAVVVPYTAKVKYDGQLHTVAIVGLPVLRCENCGEMLFNNDSNDAINRAFREQHGLLQPEVIRQQRLARGWTQQQLAEELATAEATISRWETGIQIQQRSLDNLLRQLFALPEVRRDLAPSGGPTAAAFRCLEETDELRRHARRFRLTAANRVNVFDNKDAAEEDREADTAERLTGS